MLVEDAIQKAIDESRDINNIASKNGTWIILWKGKQLKLGNKSAWTAIGHAKSAFSLRIKDKIKNALYSSHGVTCYSDRTIEMRNRVSDEYTAIIKEAQDIGILEFREVK
jgi:hypothetical protein